MCWNCADYNTVCHACSKEQSYLGDCYQCSETTCEDCKVECAKCEQEVCKGCLDEDGRCEDCPVKDDPAPDPVAEPTLGRMFV